MRTSLRLAAGLLLAAACSHPPTAPAVSTGQVTPGFTLSGIVTDAEGAPIEGARVDALGARIHSAATSADGRYRLADVSGSVAVTASTPFFGPVTRSISMTSDIILDFALIGPVLPEGWRALAVGDHVAGVVDKSVDPACEADWDAQSPCKQYLLRTRATANIQILLTWTGAADALELHLIGGALGRVLGIRGALAPQQIEATVQAGQAFEVRVMAYYGPMSFDLRVNQR